MDMEQSILHRVDSGEITAAEALKEMSEATAEFGGGPSSEFIDALAERGLVAESVVEASAPSEEQPVVEVAPEEAPIEAPIEEAPIVEEPAIIEEVPAVEEAPVAEPIEEMGTAEIPPDGHI